MLRCLIVKINLGFKVKGFERAPGSLAHFFVRRMIEIDAAFQRGAHGFSQALGARKLGRGKSARLLHMQHIDRQPVGCGRNAGVQNIHTGARARPAQPRKQTCVVLTNHGDFRASALRVRAGVNNQRLVF